MSFLVALMVAAAGMLMVSNIKYNSFKELDLKGRVPFVAILAVVLVFAVVFSDPPRILLLVFLAYAASGRCSTCCICVGAKASIDVIPSYSAVYWCICSPMLRSCHADQIPQGVRLS
jgi:phosphatidylserine synthase